MNNKRKFPPLWTIPIFLTVIPRMLWAQFRNDYYGAMKLARKFMGSAKIKRRSFQGYTPTEHDVFVCTFSKSGTYWMMQVVTQIAGKGQAEFEHIHDIVPWPENPQPQLVPLSVPTWKESPTQMRAVKTHVEAEFVPYSEAAKYVVVMRDPKDVLVSSFFFSDSIMPGLSSIGIGAWVDLFNKGEVPYGLWAEHIASFWPWRDRQNVLVLTFGEMKKDLAQVIQKVAELMQVELSDDEMALVLEKSSFQYMKANEDKFEPPTPMVNDKVELLRTGKKGEAAHHLTAEQLTSVDQAMKEHLDALRSDFPYERYFRV
ncbi:MAG: sulfotransferase domain-containing protein [Chloroflexota bacterium]